MCGIVAIYAYSDSSPAVDPGELRCIRDAMARRGPDAAGEWLSPDGRVGLGHRRLAIIDLSDAAGQPMRSLDGRFHIVFNGEIYNFPTLRNQLLSAGVPLRTTSDTEVILELFARDGLAVVEHLRGMFAFAIWDSEERRLYLARDPYGIKPLYYSQCAGTLRVASQVKALLAGGRVPTNLSPEGLTGFLCWGSVPEPFTLFDRIRQVPSGSVCIADHRGIREPLRYWAPRFVYDGQADRTDERAMAVAESQVRNALLDSVKAHLVADVPVAVFLSAGIDSTVVASLAREVSWGQLTTITLGFTEFRGRIEDETHDAERTAERLGTDHRTVHITKDEFLRELPRILDAMDQPTIDGINTYFVARAAAQEGFKVALSGVGGDEVFGGYPSFRRVPLWSRALRPVARAAPLCWLAQAFVRHGIAYPHPKAAGMLLYAQSMAGAYFLQRGLYLPEELRSPSLHPSDLSALVEAGLRRYDPVRDAQRNVPERATPHGVVACLEQSHYMRNQLLRDADWAGMHHSLEIRVPLVDRDLTAAVADLAARKWRRQAPKALLARAARPPLPQSLTARRKTGFSVPMAAWEDDLNGSRKRSGHWSRRWALRVLRALKPA
ncbi:MAG: asparagine synthase (glutamine-hydrolyzing) [Caldilineae bacterium]|nr:MAG: asparagine synthase (glutamine-hydrolyzing) [Caldilineae bacterium]